MVVTTASSVAAFEQAAQPVYAQLESDPATQGFIQAIRDLKETSPDPAAVTPCTPPVVATPTPAPSKGADPQEFPEGIYRTEMTAAELLAAGLIRVQDSGHGVKVREWSAVRFDRIV